MQTAFSITNVTFSADPVAPGLISLSVDFQIFNNGPSHVAGLVVTTDFWRTSQIAPAAFQGFGAGSVWRAVFRYPVLRDLRVRDLLRRLWRGRFCASNLEHEWREQVSGAGVRKAN